MEFRENEKKKRKKERKEKKGCKMLKIGYSVMGRRLFLVSENPPSTPLRLRVPGHKLHNRKRERARRENQRLNPLNNANFLVDRSLHRGRLHLPITYYPTLFFRSLSGCSM
uniref:Uncharacterized protein n=1 Tax=Opuntia streptacantha TaxID=393608 RepID=A0A7C9D647_OPUST